MLNFGAWMKKIFLSKKRWIWGSNSCGKWVYFLTKKRVENCTKRRFFQHIK